MNPNERKSELVLTLVAGIALTLALDLARYTGFRLGYCPRTCP
jgi:hypothetical protein